MQSIYAKAFAIIEEEFEEEILSIHFYLDFDANYAFHIKTNIEASPEFYKLIEELGFEVTEIKQKIGYLYHVY